MVLNTQTFRPTIGDVLGDIAEESAPPSLSSLSLSPPPFFQITSEQTTSLCLPYPVTGASSAIDLIGKGEFLMKRITSFATTAMFAVMLSSAALAQTNDTPSTTQTTTTQTTTTNPVAAPADTTQTTQVTTTTYPSNVQIMSTEMSNWDNGDRSRWLIRNLRPSEKWDWDHMMEMAPANIEIIMDHALANIQQTSLQQLMMMGADANATKVVTTTTTDQTPTTNTTTNPPTTTTTTTTTQTTQTYPAPNDLTMHGRMTTSQAIDTFLSGLNESERGSMREWLNYLTDSQVDLIADVVKDSFDANGDRYPYGLAWNRTLWHDHMWSREEKYLSTG